MKRLRSDHGFSARKAREAVDELVERFGLDGIASPALWAAHGGVWAEYDGDGTLELGTDGQMAMHAVVEHVASEVEITDGKIRWYPDGKAAGVMVDPGIRWGEPVLTGTRIPTFSLYEAWRAEEDAASAEQSVAELYGIGVEQVRAAVQFEARRSKSAA